MRRYYDTRLTQFIITNKLKYVFKQKKWYTYLHKIIWVKLGIKSKMKIIFSKKGKIVKLKIPCVGVK